MNERAERERRENREGEGEDQKSFDEKIKKKIKSASEGGKITKKLFISYICILTINSFKE